MRRFFPNWWRYMWLPVGWGNRFLVVVCLVSMAFVASFDNWVTFWVYAAIWLPFTLQMTLNDVYRRGRDAGEALALESMGFERMPTTAESQARLIEEFEMHINKRMVALDDLREICEKYDVPPEEMQPIVKRVFG